MEDTKSKEARTIPYFVHRDAIVHDRWIIKRLVRALIFFVVLMFVSNALWLYVWQMYDYTSEEFYASVDSEGDGIANYTGHDGGVIYGESDSAQDHNDAP